MTADCQLLPHVEPRRRSRAALDVLDHDSATVESLDSAAARAETRPSRPFSVVDRAARRLVVSRLDQLSGGKLTLLDTAGEETFGSWDAEQLQTRLVVHHPRFFRHAVLGGSLSVAESYLNGDWDCDDLVSFFRLFARNDRVARSVDLGLGRVAQWLARGYHAWHANTRRGSRRNIEAHYDLGNELFALMLDETMCYSSGVFPSPASSLHEASVEKMDRVCRKLDLRSGDHLLEIGTGWGGLAVHAATHYGCEVTTTTISREQYEWACRRIQEADLAHRARVLLTDYRNLVGQYDKLVSIEMIEAVGHSYLDAYFGQCGRLLKPDGTLVLQAIVMPEYRHAQYLRSVDFIQRYVFPGGCLPSCESMTAAAGRASDLRLVHLEDFAPHYARTLREWRKRFLDRLDDVRRLGYSERFIRMWTYYLCYCEAAFAERYIGLVQVQFDKPACRRDPGQITRHAAANHP